MAESFVKSVSLLRDYIQKGEQERAEELAKDLLEHRPEDIHSYLIMAYYYHLVEQHDDTLLWIEEALKREQEDEIVLETIVGLFDGIDNQEMLVDVVATGRNLYPNNALFHAQHAEIQRDTHPVRAKTSFKEAIRLDPKNDYYLASYALLLYQMEDWEEAEKYEQLSLQYNPENSWMLLQFAWVAYQLKRFKKAQFLIDKAIEIDPHNEEVRDMYETIYPSTNGFIRTTLEVSHVLGKMIGYPATALWRASNEKLPHRTIFIVVFILELIVLHVLLDKYLYILLGIYVAFMYVGSKVKKSLLAKIKTDAKKEKHRIHTCFKRHMLSANEVEARLMVLADPDARITLTNDRSHTDNSWTQEKLPKEYSKWARYATMAVLLIALVLRFTL